ncbi:hypothetical protein [Cupriavidus necator]
MSQLHVFGRACGKAFAPGHLAQVAAGAVMNIPTAIGNEVKRQGLDIGGNSDPQHLLRRSA